MPRRSQTSPIQCSYFQWHLRQRTGVFYADGRPNKPSLGKHSLNTRDRDAALERLRQLDLKKAIEHGKASQDAVQSGISDITLEEGWKKYLEFCGRSAVLGGVAPSTFRRYELVRKRLTQFYTSEWPTRYWHDFDRKEFERYGNWMFKRFAYRTCYVDLTQIKAAINWLIQAEILPPKCKINYPLKKPVGSDAYCYTPSQVGAMIDLCISNQELGWLGDIIAALSHTGLRFGELASLRWTDIDMYAGAIRVADERTSRRKLQSGTARTTKGGDPE